MTNAQKDLLKYHSLHMIKEENKVNNNKRYLFEDINGYRYRTSFSVLNNAKRRNNVIRRFFGDNPFTKHNMNLYLKLNNLDIYSIESFDVYKNKNAKSILKFKCYKHGHFERSWNEVYSRNSNCQACGEIIRRMGLRNSYEYVFEYCKNRGFELLSKHYGNNEHPLFLECENHGRIKTTFGGVITTKFICNECYLDNFENTIIDDNIKEILNKNKLTILDDTKNLDNQVLLFCGKCNNEVRHSLKYIQSSNFKCRECKKIDGEIKPSRDGDASKDWRRLVYEKHDYKCDICNGKGKNNALNAHHLNSWHWHIGGRFDVDNGVCLCPTHHEEFHKIYTYFNNTEEQYIKYKQEKTETKF